jgi:ADP-heptose:LPS heptosyltransferase
VKVLILKPDHLGDFALSLPSLWEVVQHLEQREQIKILVRPANLEWGSILPWLPPLEAIRHPRYDWGGARLLHLWELGQQIWQLRQEKYDFGINLIGARQDRWGECILRAVGCQQIVSRQGSGRSFNGKALHETQRLAQKLPREWQVTGETLPADFMPASWRKQPGEKILLAPATRTAAKSWPWEYWRQLYRSLPQGKTFVLAPADAVSSANEGGWPPEQVIVVHSIQETLRVLQTCSLVVALDTAVAHYAWLVGVPVVQLFAGTADSDRWESLAAGRKLSHPTICTPCGQEICFRPQQECMTNLTVYQALGAIRKVLGVP